MEIKVRQLEIIEAAGEILTESGLAGLTTKNLAAKMGFAESALYRHFKGKEEIIVTMLQYLAADMDKRLTACVEKLDDPVEKLKAVFNNQFAYFEKHPHFLVAVFSEGLLEESKKINAAIMQIMATKRKHLLPVIKQGQLEGVFETSAPAEDLLHIIMGSFRLHMLQWRMTDFSFDVKKKGNRLMDSILTLIKI
ncbi:MAG: TetR/AcrR family transcriptional regulator [Chitinophagaceae bacterium]|jgi:AcrR family transcriptional regulator|nr:TetR/AcrR family transcriptional regulator [Chitinophagaceae bacterium]NMD29307.1 TetR/AcrR family transcriptional regulator [Bacteroidota bacterium]MBK7348212.1 TetR/AcrR family transcriptional regulator [Chitinophagaceae bacterium]MBK8775823.1 TetR/AcrR family transcriptional regulator [Chitinophagaceae bacterium]MBK8930206.1 TetR/AcrR family transcriptional regulator [Chitinophagaceae bacterium]